MMSLELLAVLVTMVGVGIALSVQVRSTGRRLNDRMDRIDSRMKGIETEVNNLGKEVAHLSGLVEGLREAIVHNRAT